MRTLARTHALIWFAQWAGEGTTSVARARVSCVFLRVTVIGWRVTIYYELTNLQIDDAIVRLIVCALFV